MNLDRMLITSERLMVKINRLALRFKPEPSSHFTYICDRYLAVFNLASDYVFESEDKEFEEEFIHSAREFVRYANLLELYSDFAKAEVSGAFFDGGFSDDEYVERAVEKFKERKPTRA